MTLPEIEKVTKILTKVKQLDSEIIAIEKMARTLSENIYDVDFGLSFTPVVKNDKVNLFLTHKIQFSEIPEKIDSVLQSIVIEYPDKLEPFLEADRKAREFVRGNS